jgi:hypothetical protein
MFMDIIWAALAIQFIYGLSLLSDHIIKKQEFNDTIKRSIAANAKACEAHKKNVAECWTLPIAEVEERLAEAHAADQRHISAHPDMDRSRWFAQGGSGKPRDINRVLWARRQGLNSEAEYHADQAARRARGAT